MKEFKRLYMFEGIDNQGFTCSASNRTSFVLSIESSNKLIMTVQSGRDPYTREINSAVAMFFKEYFEEYGPVEKYHRKNRYRFCFREGTSGCQDTYIEYEEIPGFPKRKHLLHQSMYGKCQGFKVFFYDFMDLAVTSGLLSVENGFYAVPEGVDEAPDGATVTVVNPRYTLEEEGWTSPSEIPTEIVELKVCRCPEGEAPEALVE